VPTVLGGTPAMVDHWASRRPTLADDVARSMLDLLVDDTARGAVCHVTGLDTVTKYEMALAVSRVSREVGVGTDHLEPDTRPSPSRPHDTSLDCSAGPELTGYHSFVDGLRQVLPNYVKLWRERTGS
jgi:dTDP-4-dehydrorhamnose reductase